MGHSKIEWLRNAKDGTPGYSINPIKGVCKHACPYCYAIRMYQRFRWNPEVRLDLSVFDECKRMKAGSKVFVCSTHDICGSWIPDDWIEKVISEIGHYPELIFILLTKVPGRFWGISPLPSNIWLGTTVESQARAGRIETLLLVDAEKRFVSFEPLQGKIDFKPFKKLDWMIIGAQTGGKKKDRVKPEHDWITHLLWTHSNVPVFMKDNLRPYFYGEMYQQFPEVID